MNLRLLTQQQEPADHRYVRRKPYIYDLTEMANPPDLHLSNPLTHGFIVKRNDPNLFDFDVIGKIFILKQTHLIN